MLVPGFCIAYGLTENFTDGSGRKKYHEVSRIAFSAAYLNFLA